MLLKAVLISVPRFVTATTQITAIRPTSIPYSTKAAPSSSRRNRLIKLPMRTIHCYLRGRSNRLAQASDPINHNRRDGHRLKNFRRCLFLRRPVNASRSSPAQTRMMVVAVPKHRIASAAKSAPTHSQKAKDPQGAENVRNPARSRSAISVSRSYVAASRSKNQYHAGSITLGLRHAFRAEPATSNNPPIERSRGLLRGEIPYRGQAEPQRATRTVDPAFDRDLAAGRIANGWCGFGLIGSRGVPPYRHVKNFRYPFSPRISR